MSPESGPTPSRYPNKSFPFDASYDFSFRPETYWPEFPTEETMLAQVKGTTRREAAAALLDEPSEIGEEGADFLLKPGLEEQERDQWGSVHPANLGGEFLPEPDDEEVEIARIELMSTTGDVYQVLARRCEDGLIHYRVVDEYWDEGSRHRLAIDRSEQPLTLGELIELIDTERQADAGWRRGDESDEFGLFDRDREANLVGIADPGSLVGFATASSAFYPMLADYYEDRADAWLEDVRDRRARGAEG